MSHIKKIKQKLFSAFTLVELIIVIVILAILAIIAFFSFNSYSTSARDSVRLADLSNIGKGLDVYQAKSGSYPLPDEIVGTGKINGVDIIYSGIISDRISKIIGISKTPTDPLVSDINYRYGISFNKQFYQIATTTEEDSTTNNNSESLFNTAYATNSNQARVKGNYQGIIKFSSGTNASTKYYLANLPSLIFNYTGTTSDLISDKNNVFFVVNKNTNLPYSLGGNYSINNKKPDTIIQELTGNGITYFTGINITDIVIASDPITKELAIQRIFGTGGSLTPEISKSILASFNIPTNSSLNQLNESVINIINGHVGSGNGFNNPIGNAMYSNCDATDYSGFTISELSHSQTQNFYKSITNGTGIISASCVNGVISFGMQNLSCGSGYVEQAGNCVTENCSGTTPSNGKISNSISTIGGTWNYSTTGGICTFTCDTNYSWNSSTNNCDANTKTYTCNSSKPANTTRNTVSNYIQTWNGSDFLPADTPVLYNTTASTSDCNYKCNDGYHTTDGGLTCVLDTYCASNPSFSNIGTLTIGAPTSANQSWSYSATPGNCTYSCTNGYSGNNCSIAPFSAVGGTITYTDSNGLNPRTSPKYDGGYTVHTFTSNGTFTSSTGGNVDLLVVAGGGGGGSDLGGGGGAGGLIYKSNYTIYNNTIASCKTILDSGQSTGNGLYTIDPDGNGGNSPLQVYCDMTTDGGGWTRIANVRAEIPICAYNVTLGTNTNIISDTSTTGIMSSDIINSITNSSAIDGLMAKLDDGNYYSYKSNHNAFNWDNIASNMYSLGVQSYGITGSKNGSSYVSLSNRGCTSPGCLLGGYDSSLLGWSILIGIGGNARGAAIQDATCISSSSAWTGLYSGRVGATESWGKSGKIYIREKNRVSYQYSISIGNGGAGGGTTRQGNSVGSNGGNSVFGPIIAIGGGGGGARWNSNSTYDIGKNGGSGGGNGAKDTIVGTTTSIGVSGQGNRGGTSGYNAGYPGGGGGGAGGVGGNSGPQTGGGVGGIGLSFGISGITKYYAGGGGGSNYSAYNTNTSGGVGGLGGGGNGGYNYNAGGSSVGSNGAVNTGGGGGGGSRGGASATIGGTGGSGIVIIRYRNN